MAGIPAVISTKETKLTDNNHPVTGTTYYAKWTEKATPAIAIKATPSTLTGGGSG